MIHRQLDDVPTVAPESSNAVKIFSSNYKKICKILNVELAPPCPSFEKAFDASTCGTVLGIRFDSSNLSWKLPEDKRHETIWLLSNFLKKTKTNLLEFQKLHGKINDFAQLAIFLKGFRFYQNKFLQKFEDDNNSILNIPTEVKKELTVWLKCIINNVHSFPIPLITEDIPLFLVENFSDAAGATFDPLNENSPINDECGAAAITLVKGSVKAFTSVTWSYELICKYPHNSAILEAIGLVMPFIEFPEIFAGKFMKCNVDNISLIYNWEKRSTKSDEVTYKLIQILHLFEFALPCKIFVEHSPWGSSWQTKLVNNLSRKDSTSDADLATLKNCKKKTLSGPLADWCKNPHSSSDFLPSIIVELFM